MSEKKMMPDDRLDQLLNEMADETPDMPADFHARWTQAVRTEAARTLKDAEQAAKIISISEAKEKKENETKENETEKQPRNIRRLSPAWSRLIGAAAVMVFLIGGTLLTRESFHPKAIQTAVRNEQAWVGETAANSMLYAEPEVEGAAAMPELLAKSGTSEALSTAMPAMKPETETSAAEFAEEVPEEYAEEDTAAAGASEALMMAAPMAAPLENEAAEAEEAAADEEEIVWDTAEALQDGMTTNDSSRSDADTAAEKGTETAEELAVNQTAKTEDNPVTAFLKDMLLFLRWIAPWTLVLGIGILAGWLAGKKRRNERG